jgi:cell volume regulation protein A
VVAFLAVYLVGLAFGDAPLPERASVRAFHEGLAALAEIGMFFALGLLVYPSELGSIADKGVVLGLVIAFVARPLATLVATWRQRFSGAERAVLGWAGLRGAVPVVLAILPIIRGVPDSVLFFNVVFFAVLVSAAVQGLTVRSLAGRLGVVSAT